MAKFESLGTKDPDTNLVRVNQARVILLLLACTFLVLKKTDAEKLYLTKEVDLWLLRNLPHGSMGPLWLKTSK